MRGLDVLHHEVVDLSLPSGVSPSRPPCGRCGVSLALRYATGALLRFGSWTTTNRQAEPSLCQQRRDSEQLEPGARTIRDVLRTERLRQDAILAPSPQDLDNDHDQPDYNALHTE